MLCERCGRGGSAIPAPCDTRREPRLPEGAAYANSGTEKERSGRALLFLLHHHRNSRVGGEADLVAFDVCDESLVDVVVMALVAALAAVLLGQLDAVAFDAVDGADVNAVGPDHFHMLC